MANGQALWSSGMITELTRYHPSINMHVDFPPPPRLWGKVLSTQCYTHQCWVRNTQMNFFVCFVTVWWSRQIASSFKLSANICALRPYLIWTSFCIDRFCAISINQFCGTTPRPVSQINLVRVFLAAENTPNIKYMKLYNISGMQLFLWSADFLFCILSLKLKKTIQNYGHF